MDMDDGMRELTFGDLAVPREIKRATAALFDRHAAYLAALAPSPYRPLATALEAELADLAPGAAGLAVARGLTSRDGATALDAQPAARSLADGLLGPTLREPEP